MKHPIQTIQHLKFKSSGLPIAANNTSSLSGSCVKLSGNGETNERN